MAKAVGRPTLALKIMFEVDEEEAAALDALAGYGVQAFIDAFYEKMGKAYLQPHEAGLRRFLSTVQKEVPVRREAMKRAREAFANESGEG